MLGSAYSSSTYKQWQSYNSYQDIIEITEQEEKPGTFVQGDQSAAAGDYSYARGYNCLANGNYSKAEGINAYAFSDFQHVSKGSSNKFGTEEFVAGRSLYNNVITSSLTDETAIDGRYGCSGTVIATSEVNAYIKIDPQGVYLIFIAVNETSASSGVKNSVHLISFKKITYFSQDGDTSDAYSVLYYSNSLYNIIYFYTSNYTTTKLQFTLIRLI